MFNWYTLGYRIFLAGMVRPKFPFGFVPLPVRQAGHQFKFVDSNLGSDNGVEPMGKLAAQQKQMQTGQRTATREQAAELMNVDPETLDVIVDDAGVKWYESKAAGLRILKRPLKSKIIKRKLKATA